MSTRRTLTLVALTLGALAAPGTTAALAQSASPMSGVAATGTPCPDSAAIGTSKAPAAASAGASAVPSDAHRFETDSFSVGYTLPEGWSIGMEAPNALQLVSPDQTVFVNVAKLDAPIDPDDPEGRATVATGSCAAAFIDWLAQHPYLEASEPEAVELAGVSGRQVDVTLSLPTGYAGGCGADCMIVLRIVPEPAEIDRIAMDTSEKDRYIALDVGDGVLLVNIWTPGSDPATGGDETLFESGLETARPVLESLAAEAR